MILNNKPIKTILPYAHIPLKFLFSLCKTNCHIFILARFFVYYNIVCIKKTQHLIFQKTFIPHNACIMLQVRVRKKFNICEPGTKLPQLVKG